MSDKRAPVFAAIGAGLVALLAVFFFVLPKRHEVSDARAELETVQQQTAQLNVQLATLNEAEANAPQAREQIRDVDNQLPPTMDEPCCDHATRRDRVAQASRVGAPHHRGQPEVRASAQLGGAKRSGS